MATYLTCKYITDTYFFYIANFHRLLFLVYSTYLTRLMLMGDSARVARWGSMVVYTVLTRITMLVFYFQLAHSGCMLVFGRVVHLISVVVSIPVVHFYPTVI